MAFIDTPHYLQRRDADLYVEQVGPEDAPVVYYLHSGPGYNSYSFRDLLGDDLEGYRMIYADQRGGGRSYTETGFGLGELATDVAAVLDALEVERAALLAHGFGALVAVRAAVLNPELVERLVLVNPWLSMPLLARTLQRHAAVLSGRPEEALPPEAALEEGASPPPEESVDQAFAWVAAKQLFDRLEFPDPSARLRLEHSDSEALFGPNESGWPIDPWRFDVLEELAGVEAPAVLLAGRDDRTAFPDQVEAGLERLPGALFSLLPGGHYPWLDDPATFLDLLRQALPPGAAGG